VLLWATLVMPGQGALKAQQDARRLAEVAPKLSTAIERSRAVIGEWQRMEFSADDPAEVMQTVQRLADQHRVRVSELTSGGSAAFTERAVAGFSAMPLQLQVSGAFSKLARWVSAIESQAGFQIDSWSLSPDTDAPQLTISLTAFLRTS
jgi:hypothetical protein